MAQTKFLRGFFAATLVVTLLVSSFCGASAVAISPTEFIRDSTDRALGILADKGITQEYRGVKIRALIREKFDMPGISKRTLGKHWTSQDPAKQKEFMDLFTAILEMNYTRNIKIPDGFSIAYLKERVDEDGVTAMVDTKIPVKNGEVLVSYRLNKVQWEWKILDVLVENLSFASNYRSQFDTVIRTHSFDELLRRMRAKVEGRY